MLIKTNYFDNSQKEINIGKLNVFFSHSKGGKTFLLETLNDGFSGKGSKKITIDGVLLDKSEFECIYIDSKADGMEQLKLNAKSLLRSMLMSTISNNLDESEENLIEKSINAFLEPINTAVANVIDSINAFTISNNLSIKFHIDSILDIILDLIESNYADGNISLSTAKELLYSIIIKYVNDYSSKRIIVLIDDYDSFLDEELTCNFLKQCIATIQNNNVFFLLTTNKENSYRYVQNKAKVFCLKNNRIIDLSNLSLMYKYCFSSSEHKTFEEYMLSINDDDMSKEEFLKNISTTCQYGIGKLLVNRKVCFDACDQTIPYALSNNEKEKAFFTIPLELHEVIILPPQYYLILQPFLEMFVHH